MSQPVFRLAPSPNGLLHLGHAYSALLNDRMARAVSGRLLLRIEDTDQTRCKPEFVDAISEDLRWLGIVWDEPVRIQSQHFDDYEKALHDLWARGHVYPCFCSRKTAARDALESKDPDGQPHYGGTCRHLPRLHSEVLLQQGAAHGWRLQTDGTAASSWGDVMIAKPKTGSWYHIAVVVDDALQGVTHVVRGQDIEAATVVHQLLQQRLNLPTPQYHHHKLILDDEGRKFSKSLNSTSLKALRDAGVTAEDVKRQLFPET